MRNLSKVSHELDLVFSGRYLALRLIMGVWGNISKRKIVSSAFYYIFSRARATKYLLSVRSSVAPYVPIDPTYPDPPLLTVHFIPTTEKSPEGEIDANSLPSDQGGQKTGKDVTRSQSMKKPDGPTENPVKRHPSDPKSDPEKVKEKLADTAGPITNHPSQSR